MRSELEPERVPLSLPHKPHVNTRQHNYYPYFLQPSQNTPPVYSFVSVFPQIPKSICDILFMYLQFKYPYIHTLPTRDTSRQARDPYRSKSEIRSCGRHHTQINHTHNTLSRRDGRWSTPTQHQHQLNRELSHRLRLDSLRLFVNSTRRCALTEKNSVWLHSHRPSFASSRRSVRFVVSLASRYLLSLNSSSFRFVSLCRKLRIFATLPPFD